MRRFQTALVLVAAVAGLLALGLILFGEPPPPEPVFEVREGEDAPEPDADHSAEILVAGGVYGGRVEAEDGRPLAGARVLLIAYEGGSPKMLTQGAGTDTDPDVIGDVPVIGGYSIGGEGITDGSGNFRIAADAQSTITRVLAYHKGYFLSVTEVKRPRVDILLRLAPAGKVIGRVVDDETGDPVPGALVDIYLQQKVSKVPEDAGTYAVIKRKQHKTSWLASLGRFIGEVLGPRIWDVLDSHGDTLKLRTDKHGRFEIGPLGNSVQLEFVITHSRYRWTDFDTLEGKQTPARLVVEPGQTVEREFRMTKGEHVAGQVVDEEGNGVPEVFVKVQSISAYYRHWWYRHKWRFARTDAEGRFRVDGLAIGDQQIIFQHPSFGDITESVAANTDDFLVVVERFGALRGTLEGITTSKNRRRIQVILEPTGKTGETAGPQRRGVPLEPNNTFLIERVPPGTYRVWVKAGKDSSLPLDLEIKTLAVTEENFEFGAGGTLIARVVDSDGGLVDPATGRLVLLGADGKKRPMGTFVTREGQFEIEGIAPGKYTFEVNAPGRVPAGSKEFEIGRDRVANLGSLEISRYGFLRFSLPVNDRGRPVKLDTDLIIEYRRGDGPYQRLYNAGIDLPLPPGPVTYRARAGSMSYEATIDVVGGKTLDARIVFVPER